MEANMAQFSQEALLRKPEVLKLIGISNSTFYNRIQAGVLKPGVPIGPRLKGWPASEIQAYIQSCIASRDQKQGDAA
jgi:prophage regulatory protein